jgi:DNA-binding response OmpR family regulator
MRVLVVDDNPGDVGLLREAFRVAGRAVEIHEVSRVTDARLRLAVDGFALVVLDINLPGGSGLELLGERNASVAGAPFVVLSTADNAAERVRALQAGAADVLRKPDAWEGYAAIVERLVALASSPAR